MEMTLLVSGGRAVLQYLKGTLNVWKGALHKRVQLGTIYFSESIIHDFHVDNRR
jgi:hypothetical protein